MRYRDRHDAGRRLAEALVALGPERPVVVVLPRGGVPVGTEVARALHAPVEILAVRKIGAPGNPELAVGAVAEDGSGVLDQRSADMLGMTPEMLDATLEQESRELGRRVARYRRDRAPMDLRERTVIIVDDGMATGMTELAAVRAMRKRAAGTIIVAVPVGSAEAVAMLEEEADRVVCPAVPRRLFGVGMWYGDFAPVSDDEVLALLAPAPVAREELELALEGAGLAATLLLPPAARGLVVFAHGSGSGRASPRNLAVARALAEASFAALLFDLLGEREAQRPELAFEVPLLATRLQDATAAARADERLRGLPLGYFGASTGAAAALWAAAALGDAVAAVVSRGGRPDLAGGRLGQVDAPTLLVVGSQDVQVLELNRRAAEQLPVCELEIVQGASHLFEEPGALERVSELAIAWFERRLI